MKKAVLKNFAIFTGKHLYCSLFLIKLQAFQAWIFKNTYFEENLRTAAFVLKRIRKVHLGKHLRRLVYKFTKKEAIATVSLWFLRNFSEHLWPTVSAPNKHYSQNFQKIPRKIVKFYFIKLAIETYFGPYQTLLMKLFAQKGNGLRR